MPSRLAVLLLLLLLSAVAIAQDWNQWRGPSRTGGTAAFNPPAAWPDRPKLAWRVDAGIGHSSPVVAQGRVYLFSRIGDQEAVTAYELTSGKQVWRQAYDAPYQMNPAARGHGMGPKSTPVYDRGRLFTFGIDGTLSAWDTEARQLIWRKDFKKEFPATSPDFGTAMSPIVAGGLLIVHAGGDGNGAILALDPARGDLKWSWKGDGPAYASPVVADLHGVPQVITQSQRHLVSLSLARGNLLWQIPFTTDFDQNIVTPVVLKDLVIYSGLSKPLTAVSIGRQGDTWSADEAWRNDNVPMYMASPVEAGGHLFGLTHRNRGQFFAVDARTGETLWTTRGREAENAAMVVAGDLLLAATTEGELVIARATPDAFEPIKRYTIADSPIWAHPAPAGNGIVVKDAETLAYWTF